MITLIDGDIIAYRCAASCAPTKEKLEHDPVESAILRADELIYRILNTTSSAEYRVFISGTDNFRKILDPNYKANRIQERPRHLDSVRDFLLREWNAEVSAGCEADDRIGIAATKDSIIASIDKDLKQIPGRHYNFVKDEFAEVSEWKAVYNFYYQMLVGDRSDNVRGVEGIGDVRARRILSGLSTPEMEAAVRIRFPDEGSFVSTYRLLRVVRSEKELEEIETAIREGQRPELTEACSFPDLDFIPELDTE
jgi:DNA polymerase I